jgi:WD40-like Beta Propeller Repeat
MASVKKTGALSRRSVCGSGLSAALLWLTGCGGGGGGGGESTGGSTGPLNGGLTGTMFYSFTSTVAAVDLATGNFTPISGKTVGTPPLLSFVYKTSYLDISPDGKILYFLDELTPNRIAAVDIASNTVKTVFEIADTRDYSEIRLSPDGRKFAMVRRFGNKPGVYIYEISGSSDPLGYAAKSTGQSNSVSWTPDNRLLFSDNGLYLTDPGTFKTASPISTITSSSVAINPAGDKIAYASKDHIWIMGINGQNALQVTAGDNAEFQPRWSPDGKHIVFLSYVKGTNAGVGGATVTSLYYLAVIPADGKQYTLNATGPTACTFPCPGGGTVTGIAAGEGVILLQGQNPSLSSGSLHKISVYDMAWR